MRAEIRTIEYPIKMMGISMRTGMDTIYKDASALGKQYRKIKGMIPKQKTHGLLLQYVKTSAITI
jgi:hypothetical protein